ncbi:RidA family protein [bacterium]|nr:RidA family protein [bacterium]
MLAERIKTKLAELGVDIPTPTPPVGSYVPWKRSGNTIWVSGMVPMFEGKMRCAGLVDTEVSVKDAQECAKLCAVNALAWLNAATNGFKGVSGVLRLNGFVASAPGFTSQPQVLNGASDFLVEVFGDAGKHTRNAVGAAVLPLNAPVIVDFVFEVD